MKNHSQFARRVNKKLRDGFADPCQKMDTTDVRAVRRFTKRFMKRYEKGELSE